MAKRNVKCFYCNKPGKYLCDFVLRCGAIPKKRITNETTIDELLDEITNPKEVFSETCDRALCEEHRVQVGVTFWCGKLPDAGVESVDMCPGHAGVPNGHKPRHGRVGGGRAA